MNQSIRPSVSQSINLSLHQQSINQAIDPSLHLSAHPAIYPLIHPASHPSIHESIIHISIGQPVSQSVSQSGRHTHPVIQSCFAGLFRVQSNWQFGRPKESLKGYETLDRWQPQSVSRGAILSCVVGLARVDQTINVRRRDGRNP
eukprot:scaffold617650_cov17-Prasinocladus_malaysianus.AAC.1